MMQNNLVNLCFHVDEVPADRIIVRGSSGCLVDFDEHPMGGDTAGEQHNRKPLHGEPFAKSTLCWLKTTSVN
jgi:hypothetical protein